VDTATYVMHVRNGGAAFADAVRGRFEIPVPSCPEWTVADLVAHTGRVHHTVAARVRAGTTDASAVTLAVPPAVDELQAWFESGVAELAATLAAADPAQPAWSWSGDLTAGFWQRRMAQETAVHRWDAENAIGLARPIDPELAADGVDELLMVFLPFDASNLTADGRSIVFEPTDDDARWTVRITADGSKASRGAEVSPAATVRGTASEMDLLLWGRRTLPDLDVEGDPGVAEGFLGALDLT
jgi:uncharacterized protein (TIGR03083 family)